MDKFFVYLSMFAGLMSALSHFPKPHNHENCEYWLLSGIVFALIAIAAKE